MELFSTVRYNLNLTFDTEMRLRMLPLYKILLVQVFERKSIMHLTLHAIGNSQSNRIIICPNRTTRTSLLQI